MFTPLYLLPQYSSAAAAKYRDRWHTDAGRELRQRIMTMIKNGAGEDFLQWEFDQGRLAFLEDMWDLKGIEIFSEQIVFPPGDNFEAIDFSYASFYNSNFTNATFPQSQFNFAEVYNCEFNNCVFAFTDFYGSRIEHSRFRTCDFVERNGITNCSVRSVLFDHCFFRERIFFSCKCDETTVIGEPADVPNIMIHHSRDNRDLAEIFKGIRESYVAGEATKQARRYLFRQRQSITRFNSRNWRDKAYGYFLEVVTGYGLKPLRVLGGMVGIFALFSIYCGLSIGMMEGLLLSAGALFTFGANVHYLQGLDASAKAIYIVESFVGLSFMALFITVLANFWFGER